MAMTHIDIGEHRIHVGAYNPRNLYSDLLCLFAVGRTRELLKDVTVEEVHEWLRSRYPRTAKVLDAIERGEKMPVTVPPGQLPVTPGEEAVQVPIIAELLRRRRERGHPKH